MKKFLTLTLVSLGITLLPNFAQADAFVLPSPAGERVEYGLLPNPFGVATKVITAPIRAAKAQVSAARTAVKVARGAKHAVDAIDGSDSQNSSRSPEAIAKTSKEEAKMLKEWEKKHPQEAAEINRKLAEREQARKTAVGTRANNSGQRSVQDEQPEYLQTRAQQQRHHGTNVDVAPSPTTTAQQPQIEPTPAADKATVTTNSEQPEYLQTRAQQLHKHRDAFKNDGAEQQAALPSKTAASATKKQDEQPDYLKTSAPQEKEGQSAQKEQPPAQSNSSADEKDFFYLERHKAEQQKTLK